MPDRDDRTTCIDARPRRLRGARGARRGRRGRVDLRHRPRGRLAGAPRRRSSRRAATSRRRRRPIGAAIDRAIDEIGRIARPAPRHRLAVDLPAGRAARARRAAVRFQDAARDARAVVYAGIQADPLVAAGRRPARRRDARPARARPRRHERRDDRSRRLAGRCSRRCSAPRPIRRTRDRVRGDPGGLARGRRPRRAGPQPGPRRDRRGADRAACWRAGSARAAVRRERRILFDGVRRGDPPVRRDRRASPARPRPTTASGARAASTPTCCTSSTTRGRTPPTRRSGSRSRWSSSTPSARARSGSTARPRRHEGTRLVAHRDARRARRRAAMTAAAARAPTTPTPAQRAVPRPLRRGRPDGRLRTSGLLRYAQDLAWIHSASRGFDRAWYARARPHLAGPRRRASRSSAPIRGRRRR